MADGGTRDGRPSDSPAVVAGFRGLRSERNGSRRRTLGHASSRFIANLISREIGFFGINAQQVDERRSMFDDRYTPIYVLIAVIMACALAIFVGMRWHEVA
jgi:hypothetical protein